MKTRTALLMILAVFAAGVAGGAAETNVLMSDKEKMSYSIGVTMGSNWKRQEVDVDYDWVVRGLKDAKSGGPTLLTEQEIRGVLSKYQQELMARQREKQRQLQEVQRQLAETNKVAGEAFLAANKDKPGIVTLPSGLQYKIITEGDGASPKPEDTVIVNYRGTLIDGTEFDSSFKNNRPATFRVNGVVRGWTEALTRMKAGSKWQLFIPSELAYGPRGHPPLIGPNAALVFEVELLTVQPAPPPATTSVAPASPPPLTSDIIKVPSQEEMQKGAKIETIKAEDLEKLQKQQRQESLPPPEQPQKP